MEQGFLKKRQFRESTANEELEGESSESPCPSPPLLLEPLPSFDRNTPDGMKKDKQRNKSGSPDETRYKKKTWDRKERSESPDRRTHRDDRKSSPSYRRKRRSRSPARRMRSRSRSRELRKRARSRSCEKRKGYRRHRSRSGDRKRRSHSKEKRSVQRSSTSPPKRYCSKWAKPSTGLTRAVLPLVPKDKKQKVASTSEVEQRVARHMKSVKEKNVEEAKRINLPGYLNPAMINVHQFKQVQDKRKLLWSKPKDKKEGASQWAGAFDDQTSEEKFKRLMGIQGIKVDETESAKVHESRKVLDNLEKEYEKSRAFQLSRGAGGVTGIGLGFGTFPSQPP